jgi:hypothetical protein
MSTAPPSYTDPICRSTRTFSISTTGTHPESIDVNARRVEITPKPSLVSTPLAEYSHLLQPTPRAILTRHYTSLQEHADYIQGSEAAAGREGQTPRHEGRREGFSWGAKPVEDGQRVVYTRNPLPPERHNVRTPPPLEELLRRSTNEDADEIQNAHILRTNSAESQLFTARVSTSSTFPDRPTRVTTGRPSISAFARGLARHVPDMNFFAPSDTNPGSPNEPERHGSLSGSLGDTSKDRRLERKLSFVPQPSLKTATTSVEKGAKSLPIPGEAERSTVLQSSISSPPPAKGSLRDRRKVKLDLSMPVEMPDLPARGRTPVGQLSSITPSRPRSPKTPWLRSEPPQWQLDVRSRATPIMEDYIGETFTRENDTSGLGLLPGQDRIESSQSPRFERPPQKVRDRSHVTQPKLLRGRSGRSGASETEIHKTPDSSWTPVPDKTKAPEKRPMRTPQELAEFGQNTVRSSRWRWKRSTTRSSESIASPIAEAPTSTRKFSVNPFKRCARIDELNKEKEEKQQCSPSNRAWWLPRKQSLHNNMGPIKTAAQIPVPPTFNPPEKNRIPTPPMFDNQGEVKGKLADFFFDHGAGIRTRRPKASPGGYWDSDALLMSVTTDLESSSSSSDEGPEGPPTPSDPAVRFFTMDRSSGRTTPQPQPGMVNVPGGYLGIKTLSSPRSQSDYRTSPASDIVNDIWFRIATHDVSPDEATLGALAVREEEERRKFEWIVPEHLPSSPLCPLHSKYHGPFVGTCLWHSKRKSVSKSKSRKGSSANELEKAYGRAGAFAGFKNDISEETRRVERRGSRGWEVGKVETETRRPRMRRLESLSGH